MSNNYLSEYYERINRTPADIRRWSGKRGESECAAVTAEAQAMLDKHGLKGVRYSDGIPDFSPFSEATVSIDKMTGSRTSQRTRLVEKNNSAFGRAERYKHITKIGNYNQADIAAAKEWTSAKKEGRNWRPRDVERFRKQRSLTWHECNDRKTMMLVPQIINSEFTHLGGTSEAQLKGNLENLETSTLLYQIGESKEKAFQRASERKYDNTHINVVSRKLDR